MAPKKQPSRQPTKEKVEEEPPKLSSDEEEEEEDDAEEQSQETQSEADDDDDASSEDEQQQQQQKEEQLVKTPNPAPKSANESGTESESESESEDVNPSAYKVQPIMPKPAPAKRAHQETDDSRTTTSKKAKAEVKKDEKKTTPANPGTTGLFTRLWSDDDEIAVLKGMIEFKEQKGVDPSADLAALHSFVKGKLKVDFSKDQLKSKIGRLKKRFVNASKRGEDPVFSNPHEIMVFELAKRIWGAGAGSVSKSGVGKVSKSGVAKVSKVSGDATDDEDAKKKAVDVRKEENGVVKKDAVVVRKEGDGEEFWSKYPFLRASFDSVSGNYPSLVKYDLVKEKLSLIGSDKAKELDDKWKKLIWEEAQLNYKMLGLMNEQVEVALNH